MAGILPRIINAAVRDIQLYDSNKLIEKNTWNCTIYSGDENFCYCRHVYFMVIAFL